MCVIVAKPKGVEFPSIETLMDCWDANPDGAGIMWNEGDSVRIEKGFMTWNHFMNRFKRIKDTVDIDETSVVFHFRIATHGEVSRECCHPFPMSNDLDVLRRCKTHTEVGIAHNGVISGRSTNARKSDTMDYIMKVIYPLYMELDDFMWRKNIKNVIKDTIDGSRMVFLQGNGDLSFIGNWAIEDECYYSNLNHKWSFYYNKNTGKNTKPINTLPYGWWDDDDDVWYPQPTNVKMDGAPCELCEQLCTDYDYCVMAGEWFCLNEEEALQIIEDNLMNEAMKNDYYNNAESDDEQQPEQGGNVVAR